MARLKDLADGVSDLFKIDPRIIKVQEGFNVRQPGPALDEHIAKLSNSIAVLGVQTPLTVRLEGDEVLLVDGHCRLAATLKAIESGSNIQTVPCIPEGRYADEGDRTLMLVTRNDGKPLEPLEKAEVFKRLIGFGWTEDKIAQKAGLSTKQVQNLLTLSAAPMEVKELVSSGEVAASTAIKTIKQEGSGKIAAQLLSEAVQTAKANGQAKVTPKTVAQTRAVTNPAPAPKPLSASVAPQEAPAPALAHMPANTPGRFREMVEALQSILDVEDIKIAHVIARDALAKRK